jgi:tetratricopeptide (TPR) repeat protein
VPTRSFKHALTHLVAYRSVPAERQRALHRRILGALERLPPGQPDAHAEALAEHAVRGEHWRRAVDHLREAGTRALARSANRAAADYLERALQALGRTDDPEALADLAIDLRLNLRHALTPLGEVDRILHHLREAETVAERVGDRWRLGRVLSFQTNGLFAQGDHTRAIACGRRAMAIARDLGDVSMAIAAEQFVGRALHAQGQYRAAAEIFGRVAASLSGEHARENLGLPVPPAVFARSHVVWCQAELGAFDDAQRAGDEAVRLAEAIGQPEALQWAYYSLGVLALERGELDTAVMHLDRVLTICRGADLPVYVPRTAAALAHAQALLGQAPAVAALEHAVAEAERRRQVNVHTPALARLAEVYLHAGRIEDAARAAERAVDLARKRGERGTEARTLRLQAEALRRSAVPRFGDAEAAGRAALAIAEELGMRPQVALARLELGRALHAAGRHEEAVASLREADSVARELGLSRVAASVREALSATG